MEKKTRLKIGLIFRNDMNWIGGTYYLLNLVHALKKIEENSIPLINIYATSKEDFIYIKNESSYPNLKYTNSRTIYKNVIPRIINKISRTILKKDVLIKKEMDRLNVYFPNPESTFFKKSQNKLFWVPDLQEIHYPDFFPKQEKNLRHQFYKMLSENRDYVVFSSNASCSDFFSFIPDAKIFPFILPFAVTHPDFRTIEIQSLFLKFNIPSRYFICPNQFWVHKIMRW